MLKNLDWHVEIYFIGNLKEVLMEFEKNFDFDPDMCEYNPIFAELKGIKEAVIHREDENFVINLVKILRAPSVRTE